MDNLQGKAAALVRTLPQLVAWLRRPPVEIWRGRWSKLLDTLTQARRTPSTSLNRPAGPRLRFAVLNDSLPAVRHATHLAHATVNDAVLAAVAGGLRELLCSRGEKVAGTVLQAMVPITLQGSPETATGNQVGGMVVPLPVGEPNSVQRLRLITAQTSRRKHDPGSAWGTGIFGWTAIQVLALRLADRQHFIAVHVTNVRGPSSPRYLAGARLTTMFPVVPLSANLILGIGVLSYIDQLNITVAADRDHCPDLPRFTVGLRHSLSDLTAPASRVRTRPSRPAR